MNKKTRIYLFITLAIALGVVMFLVRSSQQADRTNQLISEVRDDNSTKSLPSDQVSNAGQIEKPWISFTKPTDSELRNTLTDEQYRVSQKDGTEFPYRNEYWDNVEPGIYVDIVSGEPLFSSIDKYESGTGWPSFTQPLPGVEITTQEDTSLVAKRIEARSPIADSHLGHIFPDGPTTIEASDGATPTGLRYCLNSAALRFVPLDDMEAEGYGEYLYLFE